MADTKLSALTALGAAPATNDLIYIDDVSATTSKSMTVANLFTSPAISTPTGIVKGDVGLGNVDNTSDATKNSASAVLTNKTLIAISNVVEEITTTASSSTPTPTGGSLRNYFTVTALAANATIGAPTGSPVDGNKLFIRIKDNATPRTLAFNAIYRFSSDLAAPSTTVTSKTLYMGFIYNGVDSKWDMLALLNNV